MHFINDKNLESPIAWGVAGLLDGAADILDFAVGRAIYLDNVKMPAL